MHRAVLRETGEEVVTKVQHRKIQQIMRQDLRDLFVIVDWVAYFEPTYNFLPVLDEWSKVSKASLGESERSA